MEDKQENKNLISVNDFYKNDNYKDNNLNNISIGIESLVNQCNYEKLWQDIHDINPTLIQIDENFDLTTTQIEIIQNFYDLLNKNSSITTTNPTNLNNNSNNNNNNSNK